MIPMMKLTMTYENKTNAMPTMTLMSVCLSWLWASSVPEMALKALQTSKYRATLAARLADQVITRRIRLWKLIFGPGRVANSSPRRAWEPARCSVAFSKASRPVSGLKSRPELVLLSRIALTFALPRSGSVKAVVTGISTHKKIQIIEERSKH